MTTVTLATTRDQFGTRHLGASRLPSGDLAIEGQDLGTDLPLHGLPGVTEYEYGWTIAAADVPRLITAPGGPADADPLELLRQRCASESWPRIDVILRDLGTPSRFWSRFEQRDDPDDRG